MNEQPAEVARTENEKQYSIVKNISKALEIIAIVIAIGALILEQFEPGMLKTGLVTALGIIIIVSFVEFIMSMKLGILNKRNSITLLTNKTIDIYKEKDPEEFEKYQRSRIFLSIVGLVAIFWAFYKL